MSGRWIGGAASRDGPRYAIEREFEDVAAVVDTVGGPVDVVGFSFGAPVALGALPLTPNVRRAVLYDPGAFAGDDIESWADALDDMLARGQHELMLTKLYRFVCPEDEDPPAVSGEWDLAVVPTIPRESRDQDYRPSIRAHSPLWRRPSCSSRGHGHVALAPAPEMVARHILGFLQADRPPRDAPER